MHVKDMSLHLKIKLRSLLGEEYLLIEADKDKDRDKDKVEISSR